MKRSFEQVLDTCLAQLNRGMELEVILAAHPEVAADLRPLLAAAAWTRIEIPPPVRYEANKSAFLAAVVERRRLVAASNALVVELKAGMPLGELLESAPANLRPLIVAAWRMHTTPPPPFSRERAAAFKRRLVAMMVRRRSASVAKKPLVLRTRAILGELMAGLLPAPTVTRRAWSGAMGMAMAMMLVVVGLAGIGTSAASSLPGEPFYRVKRLGESAQMLFAIDPVRRADLNIRFSDRRLQEMKRLAGDDREVPLDLVEAWLRGHSSAWTEIQKLPMEQQRRLAETLLSSMAEPGEFEVRLREVVADPAALELLLEWAQALADTARESVGSSSPPIPPEPAQVAPQPVVRPLPDEDEAEPARPSVDEASEPVVPIVQPDLPSAPVVTSEPVQEPPPVVQPVNDAPAERDRGDDEKEAPAPPQPTEPPAEEPTPELPPPYVQPPVGEPAP